MEPIAGNRGVMGSGDSNRGPKRPRNHVIGRFAVARGGYLRSDTRADIVGRTPMAIVSKGRSSMAIQRASPHRSWGSRFSSHARTSVILERQPFLRRCRFVVVD